MRSSCNQVVCFDLDDTLYKEIDFLRSAYREIVTSVGHSELAGQMVEWFLAGENAFQKLNQVLGTDKPVAAYLDIYRNHKPTIGLSDGVKETLDELRSRGVVLGLITDGRSVSQRNKIEALGLYQWFDDKNIIISEEFGNEKPCVRNYQYFETLYPYGNYVYVGDNPQKDFVTVNQRGWDSFCLLDDGRNVHPQDFTLSAMYLPKHKITSVRELLDIL